MIFYTIKRVQKAFMNSIIKKQNLKNKQTFYEFQNNNQMRKDATKKNHD
jgi:hypothetical protein